MATPRTISSSDTATQNFAPGTPAEAAATDGALARGDEIASIDGIDVLGDEMGLQEVLALRKVYIY